MNMMTAARLHEVGKPFQLDEVAVPALTGSDVLVRVRACGVVPNLKNVVTHYPEWFPFLPLPTLPAIYGLDPAGEIARAVAEAFARRFEPDVSVLLQAVKTR